MSMVVFEGVETLVVFVVVLVEIERWGGSPKPLPSVRQNACVDCIARFQEGEDVEEEGVWKRADSID